ncbi:glucose 1-dehydrogenase [Mesorhizobium sp. M0862]|uniref:SDR family NAD(P)-dependent oxidoreductase n=1 Tax=Mesorhizobium sp. M0862 TaxID=2957015 RepID=UPI003335B95F
MSAAQEPGLALPVTPSFRLDGRRALVTGAGRGLGVAIAAALADAGAQVQLIARTASDVEAVAAAIEARGGRAGAALVDVTDLDQVRAALGAMPAFDILVNNAGTNRPKPMTEVTPADFAAIFDLNVRAAFFVSQAVVDGMIADGRGGSIINISSQMGLVGAPNRTLYCASKHALEGLTKAMAVELAARGIRVNTIAPTFVETPMTRPYLEDPAFSRDVLSKIKLGRLGRVEDIMGAVVYLASDASALVTGTALVVDGGWTAD